MQLRILPGPSCPRNGEPLPEYLGALHSTPLPQPAAPATVKQLAESPVFALNGDGQWHRLTLVTRKKWQETAPSPCAKRTRPREPPLHRGLRLSKVWVLWDLTPSGHQNVTVSKLGIVPYVF